MTWITGDVSGAVRLTENDHLYCDHINELRASMTADATVSSDPDCQYACDGVADNVELQAAINAVSAEGGGRVYVRSNLSLAAAVMIATGVEVDLGGNTVTLANGANSRAFYTPTGGSSNILLRNGIVDGNRTNQTSGGTNGALVDIGGNGGDLVNARVENLYVKNSYQHGIYIHGSGYYTKVIQNCIVRNHGSASVIGFGIYADFAPNAVITGCTVFDSNGNDSIELGNSGQVVCTNNYIEDGDIQFPFSHNAVIANNILRLGKILNDTNTANGVTIMGNQLVNATPATSGYAAIRVDGARSRIIGNYVFCNQYDGIKVQNGDGHIIEGNYVESDAVSGGTETGILAASTANNVQIKNNTIKNYDIAARITWDNVDISSNKAITCTTGVQLTSSALSGHVILNANVLDNDFRDTTTGFDPTNQSQYLGQVKRNAGINPERFFAVGNSGTSKAIDRLNGDHQLITMNGNCVFAFTAGKIKGDIMTLELTQTTGSHTGTWPSNFKKAGGTLTLSTAAGATDTVTARWDGTNWVEISRAIGVS